MVLVPRDAAGPLRARRQKRHQHQWYVGVAPDPVREPPVIRRKDNTPFPVVLQSHDDRAAILCDDDRIDSHRREGPADVFPRVLPRFALDEAFQSRLALMLHIAHQHARDRRQSQSRRRANRDAVVANEIRIQLPSGAARDSPGVAGRHDCATAAYKSHNLRDLVVLECHGRIHDREDRGTVRVVQEIAKRRAAEVAK